MDPGGEEGCFCLAGTVVDGVIGIVRRAEDGKRRKLWLTL